MNKLTYKLLLSIALLISYVSLSAKDSYMVHIDKPYYITGEKILFKLYYPEVKDEVAIRILLVDGSNNVVQDFYGKSSNSNYLASCVSIPFNYESGTYRLVFNGNFKDNVRDEEITLTEIAFPIYSDLSAEQLQSAGLPDLDSISSYDLANELEIQVSPSASIFNNRGEVALNIKVKDKNGAPRANASVSVSVIRNEIAESLNDGLEIAAVGPEIDGKSLPAIGGDVYFKGTVFNNARRPVRLSVIGAYADQYKAMQYTKSTADGAFTMGFPDLSGEQTIQFLHYEKEIRNFKVELAPAKRSNQLMNSVYYNDQVANVIAQSKAKKKMDQYFGIEPSVNIKTVLNEIVANDESDISFVVNEYEKFDRVYDFFSELITPLSFKKVKKETIAVMNNPKSIQAVATELEGNPLFIIDGRMTRDAEFAGNLKMSNIETIELIYSPLVLRKRFNVLGLSGVVIINTITPVFEFPKADSEDIFMVKGLQGDCSFRSFDATSAAKNHPHFQSTIYWNADLTTNSSGEVKITFDHPDNTGEFSIIVVAQDTNGIRGSDTGRSYEVRNSN